MPTQTCSQDSNTGKGKLDNSVLLPNEMGTTSAGLCYITLTGEHGKASCIRTKTYSEQVSTTATLVVAGVLGLNDEWHFHSKDLTLQTAWCLSSRDISSCAVNIDEMMT